ncbi:MAG: hydrogenase formation protein HypD [bacterium]
MLSTLKEIKKLAKRIKRQVKLMEVCGTHTQVIAGYGIKEILPSNIKLISGPGCPVCVTAKSDIDNIVAIALAGIPVASYGDMLRVIGTEMSLAEARQKGADVREVYTAEEIFKLNKKTVFFGIGFETTAPMTASIVKRGAMVYCAHKAFIPAMRALLGNGEIKIDGLISPGHVAAIVGADVFGGFYDSTGNLIPQVITGFELEDVLAGIMMLLAQIAENRTETENEYNRVVRPEGNKKALDLMNEVFELEDSEWRGLGDIAGSGFKLRKFADRDAKMIYTDILEKIPLNPPLQKGESRCLCSEVIKGLSEPKNCSLYRKVCNPENPQGPCMVSREGACHIAYKNKK